MDDNIEKIKNVPNDSYILFHHLSKKEQKEFLSIFAFWQVGGGERVNKLLITCFGNLEYVCTCIFWSIQNITYLCRICAFQKLMTMEKREREREREKERERGKDRYNI